MIKGWETCGRESCEREWGGRGSEKEWDRCRKKIEGKGEREMQKERKSKARETNNEIGTREREREEEK